MSKQLSLGREKLFLGVCSGIAEYFNVDVNLVRLIYLIFLVFFPQQAILWYLLAYFIMSKDKVELRDLLLLLVFVVTVFLLIFAISRISIVISK